MKQIDLSQLTDQELINESKKIKSTSIINAVLIGFLFGIIIYSILVNSIGFFTLIPLFFIFKLFNNSKNNEALSKHNEDLEKLLKERKLK
jgi:ABC-type phosphate transport system permease subunit